ncbi:MAG: hypothetical protein ACLR2E_20940 [Lachnospiraceae bacterium]
MTSLLETYAAAERIFKIEDSMPETEERSGTLTGCDRILKMVEARK